MKDRTKRKIFTTVIISFLLIFIALLFAKPLTYYYYAFGSYDFSTEYQLESVILSHDDEIDSNPKPNVIQYSQISEDTEEYINIYLPSFGKPITLLKLSDENPQQLKCCYKDGELYYFITSSRKNPFGPLTAKNHESDRLISLNSKNHEVNEIYKAEDEQILICGNNEKALIFDSKNLTFYYYTYQTQKKTDIKNFTDKKDIIDIDLKLEKDFLNVKINYAQKSGKKDINTNLSFNQATEK